MKKLERQRAQEEQAKRQEEEEAAAQRSDRGGQLGPGEDAGCGLKPSLTVNLRLSVAPHSLSLCFSLSLPSFFSLPPSSSSSSPPPAPASEALKIKPRAFIHGRHSLTKLPLAQTS